MVTKIVGIVLIVVGALLALASVLADALGFGLVPGTFGFSQIIGTVVGVAALIIGIILLVRSGRAGQAQ
jgi:hypothetical protein